MQLSHKPRTILIDVIPSQTEPAMAERRLLELDSLTRTYGGMTIVKLYQRKTVPDYRTYIGSGKVQEIISLAQMERVELLIINNLLKPKQLFEIEELARAAKYPLKVWDRVDLILKIFSKHATSTEAKLQIKLAAIRHMGPRIFGMGMEMMQQVGGVGVRGGQGETNTELMKRHLAQQEKHTIKELERVSSSREMHRKRRDRLGLKTVSIVGYTNAGKSSLLRSLTGKQALVADKLFATLDTRIGKMTGSDSILLSDTIGFIQDLPPQLIKAFRSTLDETVDADLLLHVIDVSDPYMEDKIKEVESVLDGLGLAQTPKIYVFNKIDARKKIPRATLKKQYKLFSPIFVSSLKGVGLEELKCTITNQISF